MNTRLYACLVLSLGAAAPFTPSFAGDAQAAPNSLFADRRARAPGDVLTVLVSESASVTSNAQTRLAKGESANAHLLQRDGEVQLADAGFDSKFAGGGRIERSGTLLARLSVQVDSVDANGNFLVSGEQLIVMNNEKQKIRVSGVVRPDDIAADNTVPSWRVAGTSIQVLGKGILTRKSSPGVLTWLLSLFGE
ncbi:MAG TPA: flagellar basal body L-ring protein FlgH [Steroidobacteraceae bacterium]|jgi:flagellar L-ring protein precursor FlgH|nr:flagellar basal body L-ring protein FlgH [Steroidobacteraceae bacterium]